MSNKIKQIVESRLSEQRARRSALTEAWSPYVSAIDKYLQTKENRSLSDHDKRNIAQVCENALLETGMRSQSRIFETTYQDNIEFLGVSEILCAA